MLFIDTFCYFIITILPNLVSVLASVLYIIDSLGRFPATQIVIRIGTGNGEEITTGTLEIMKKDEKEDLGDHVHQNEAEMSPGKTHHLQV